MDFIKYVILKSIKILTAIIIFALCYAAYESFFKEEENPKTTWYWVNDCLQDRVTYRTFKESESTVVEISNHMVGDAMISFESAIVNECNLRLSKWFIVSQMRSNIIPPEALQEAIIAKTKSVQQAEASKQQAIAAGADGQRKIAVARADSAETVINASAKAKAMELTQQKLTPLYVEYKKIEKWDGRNSETVLGNSSNTLVNVK